MDRYETMIEQAKSYLAQAEALLDENGSVPDDRAQEFDDLMDRARKAREQAERLRELSRLAQEVQGVQEQAQDRVREDKAFWAAWQVRFGNPDEAMDAILADIIGSDYRHTIWRQNQAFAKYLRAGTVALDPEDHKILRQQIFPAETIKAMIQDGLSVREIKVIMVEAQGTLGGYAVPPNVQAEIIRRLPGLTVVRQAGARVITLTTGNAVEIPVLTGGNDQYPAGVRGQWGTETQTPAEQNATLGMVQVVAGVYTYKVPMSQSLVEDAANLVQLVQAIIAETLAVDEDQAFLVGDGTGKPLGILPGGANTLGLREVNSGSASALTADGIKRLKRGVPSQYRRNAVWVANSATWEAVELLKDANGQYLFPDMSDEDMLLSRRAMESEALPDVAANAYPIVFGDMTGYYIVERAGLTIARYQDSNTGPNVVEFHVRRRVGGRVAEPWKFAVQKVAA